MCQMLYMATEGDQAIWQSPELRVEEVEASRAAIRQWFSLPVVRFIGAYTGCSCGFPSVIAEEPVEYFEGMVLGDQDREAELGSVRSLLRYMKNQLAAADHVELYPVWEGEEGQPPKGVINIRVETVVPETFFFNQRFLYRVTGAREA